MKDFTTYLELKDLANKTIADYIEIVTYFLKYIEKEETQITKPDILNYLEHLKNKKLENATRQKSLIVLNHYFEHLFEENQVIENPCINLKIRGTKKQKLCKIYTPAELQQLFDNYNTVYVRNFDDRKTKNYRQKISELCKERNAVMLSILIHQGISIKEVMKIELNDLDLKKLTLKMKGCKTNRKRNIPLKPYQMGLFIYYLNDIHPQILEYQTNETNKLFLPLPPANKRETDTLSTKRTIYYFKKQLQVIDKQFTSFHQLRASVITQWLKDYGLRKTQYLSGHYKVASTEKYQANNLDDLTNDINNLHPF